MPVFLNREEAVRSQARGASRTSMIAAPALTAPAIWSMPISGVCTGITGSPLLSFRPEYPTEY
jgi:hypothetical protein